MALIVYPATGYNSFVTLAEADLIIEGFTIDHGYMALDDPAKEAFLKQSAFYIIYCDGITLPATAEDDLKLAQCYNATYSITNNPLDQDPNQRAITLEKVGSLRVEYNPYLKKNPSAISPVSATYLKQYGCSMANTSRGFSQGRAGVS